MATPLQQPPWADPGGPVPTGLGQAQGAIRSQGTPSTGWAYGVSQRPDEEALASHPLALSMEESTLEAGPPAWHPEGTSGVTPTSSRGRQVRHPCPEPARVARTPRSPTPGVGWLGKQRAGSPKTSPASARSAASP